MPVRSRTRAGKASRLGIASGTGFVLLLGLMVFSVHSSGDYRVGAAVGGNNSAPGLQALMHGSLIGYLRHQPVIGLTSILLRLPLMALAAALGAGHLLTYQFGTLACLLVIALGGAWLVSDRQATGSERLCRLLAVTIVIESPILRDAVAAGHPETVVAMALAVAAVIAAMRERSGLAAVILGLAIAAKETGVIAALPVLIALPGRRRQVCLIAAGVIALLNVSVWLADPSAFLAALHGEDGTHFVIPVSLVWPLTFAIHVADGQVAIAHAMRFGLTRGKATLLRGGVASVIGAVWYVNSLRRGATVNPLAFLAMLGLLRCICDSTSETYYYLSVLIPIAALEGMSGRLPVATGVIALGIPLLFDAVTTVPATAVYLMSTTARMLLLCDLGRQAMRPAARPPSHSIGLRPRVDGLLRAVGFSS